MIDETLVMMLRSKSALSRLSSVEVRAVIAVMEELGFKSPEPAAPGPAGVTAIGQVPPSFLERIGEAIESHLPGHAPAVPPPPAQ